MYDPLIAIIEDDEDVQAMLHAVLTMEGYRTLRWSQGKDAHLRIREAQPDLVILDLWMENKEAGSTVLDLMRHDPRTQQIPVIICSAQFLELRRLFRRGALKGCVVVEKPFNIEELLTKIRTLLSHDAGA
jgi:DNA-binding response OmpR family regulator